MFRRYLALCAVLVAASALTACGGSDPESLTFDISVKERAIMNGEDTFTVKQGDTVTFNLSADEDATFHVHGYDLSTDVQAHNQAALTFEASATGSFPLAMHFTGAAGHSKADGSMQHGNGHNETIEAPAGLDVALEIHPDAVDGFNVRIVTRGFTFAPEHASGDHGHGGASGGGGIDGQPDVTEITIGRLEVHPR